MVETVEFVLTSEEYVDLYAAFHERWYQNASMRWYAMLLPSAAIALLALQSDDKLYVALGGAAVAVFIASLSFGMYYSQPKREVVRHVRGFIDPMALVAHSYRITDEGMTSRTNTGDVNHVASGEVMRIDCDSAIVLASRGGESLFYLPKRVFKSDEDYDWFCTWAQALPRKRPLQ